MQFPSNRVNFMHALRLLIGQDCCKVHAEHNFPEK